MKITIRGSRFWDPSIRAREIADQIQEELFKRILPDSQAGQSMRGVPSGPVTVTIEVDQP